MCESNSQRTINDCLMEAWTARWHNLKYPAYKSPDTGTANYLESDFIAGNGTALTLKYQAKIDSTSSDNNQGGSNTGGSSSEGQTNSNNNKKLDPVMIVLITISSILGLILLFYIYKLIRMIIRWCQRK